MLEVKTYLSLDRIQLFLATKLCLCCRAEDRLTKARSKKDTDTVQVNATKQEIFKKARVRHSPVD